MPSPGDGIAFVDGKFLPLSEATVGLTDWGFVRSDTTYDVVSVWNGSFFRLEDHLDRFEASMAKLRMSIPYDRDGVREILTTCVARSGLRKSYVAMVTTRGLPAGPSRMPGACRNRFHAYARPWVWVMTPDVQERGGHLVVPKTVRISPDSIDPTVKNYHWGDMTYGLFEAEDKGADSALLTDADGFVTEGPGFNVFSVHGHVLVTPDKGALEGITRLTMMELAREAGMTVEVRPIHIDEMKQADEVFAASTAGGPMPISRIDERLFSNDAPGPVSVRLKDMYWSRRESGWHATPVDYGDG